MKYNGVNPLGNRRGARQSSRKSLIPTSTVAVLFVFVLIVFYCLAAAAFLKQRSRVTPQKFVSPKYQVPKAPVERTPVKKGVDKAKQLTPRNFGKSMTFHEWRKVATDLAAMTAEETLQALETQDPFGMRTFEKGLLEQESKKGATLTMDEIIDLFPCPKDRISVPDARNHTRDEDFRNGKGFLFFQHLRKAGGTNFCSLAEANLPRKAVPSYFCMPDMYWTDKRCAGCLHGYSNDVIIERMERDGHRIAGNEWDNFDPKHHFGLPAVHATSFRRPLDRAISQFRFECVEDRGCKFREIEPYWEKRKDLSNVFTRTFSDTKERLKILSQSKDPNDGPKRAEVMGDALDTLSRFHLVLVMEWLAYATPLVQKVLGFRDTSALTHRVRPHIGQYKRNDGQEENKLGASGIAKASWTPKNYLSPAQYKTMSEDLALDEILTDAGRRFFLERLVCND